MTLCVLNFNKMYIAISILFIIYSAYVGARIYRTNQKRKHLKVGDTCHVYLGENRFLGYIEKVNHEIDVWVTNKIIRFTRSQIYA